jgi:PAS domain S-box-containing protein
MKDDYVFLDKLNDVDFLDKLPVAVNYLNYFILDAATPLVVNTFFNNILPKDKYAIIYGKILDNNFYINGIWQNSFINLSSKNYKFSINDTNDNDLIKKVDINFINSDDFPLPLSYNYFYYLHLNVKSDIIICTEHIIPKNSIYFINQLFYIINNIKITLQQAYYDKSQEFIEKIIVLISDNDNQLLVEDPFAATYLDIPNYISSYENFYQATSSFDEYFNIKVKQIALESTNDKLLLNDNKNTIAFINIYENTTYNIKFHIICLENNNYKTQNLYNESLNKYKNILENIQSVYYEITDNVITEISPSVHNYTGYSRDELIGMPSVMLFYSVQEREEYIRELREKQKLKNQLLKLIDKNGQIIYCLTNSKMIIENDSQSNLTTRHEKIIGSLMDISDIINYKQELENRNIELLNLINNDLIGVIYSKVNGEIILCNALSRQYILGDANDKCHNLLKSKYFNDIIDFNELVEILNNKNKFYKLISTNRNNKTIDYDLQATMIQLPHSNKKRILIFITDITEKILINKELNEITLNFNDIINNIQEPLFIYDEQGILLYANPKFYKYLKYDEQELLNKNISIFTPSPSYELLLNFKKIRNLKCEKKEITLINKTGIHQLYEAVFSCRYNYKNSNYMAVVLLHNIEEQKMFEKNLLQNINEKENLIKEIHHRTKNNLQLILSMIKLNLQKNINLKNTNAIYVLKDLYNKVSLLSFIQNELYFVNNSNTADIKPLLIKETKRLIQDYNDKIILNLNLPDQIIMHVDVAIPFMISYMELIFNSIIHAFPKKWQNPTIYINIEKNDDNLNAKIVDNGIGIQEHINREFSKTLGLFLVDNLIKYQLNGQFEIKRNTPNGTIANIELKNIELKK